MHVVISLPDMTSYDKVSSHILEKPGIAPAALVYMNDKSPDLKVNGKQLQTAKQVYKLVYSQHHCSFRRWW